jgi:hypothetical protein
VTVYADPIAAVATQKSVSDIAKADSATIFDLSGLGEEAFLYRPASAGGVKTVFTSKLEARDGNMRVTASLRGLRFGVGNWSEEDRKDVENRFVETVKATAPRFVQR